MSYSELTTEPIEIDALTQRVRGPQHGACVVFTGEVRDHDAGKQVVRLHYSAYDELARKQMAQIAGEAECRWPDVACAVVHRIGSLEIGECSVAVAVAAPHRAEAFEACRWAIDAIKKDVPIWKREEYADSDEVWIEGDRRIRVEVDSTETDSQRVSP